MLVIANDCIENSLELEALKSSEFTQAAPAKKPPSMSGLYTRKYLSLLHDLKALLNLVKPPVLFTDFREFLRRRYAKNKCPHYLQSTSASVSYRRPIKFLEGWSWDHRS